MSTILATSIELTIKYWQHFTTFSFEITVIVGVFITICTFYVHVVGTSFCVSFVWSLSSFQICLILVCHDVSWWHLVQLINVHTLCYRTLGELLTVGEHGFS